MVRDKGKERKINGAHEKLSHSAISNSLTVPVAEEKTIPALNSLSRFCI